MEVRRRIRRCMILILARLAVRADPGKQSLELRELARIWNLSLPMFFGKGCKLFGEFLEIL